MGQDVGAKVNKVNAKLIIWRANAKLIYRKQLNIPCAMGVFALEPLPMAQNLTPVHHGILQHSARVETSTLSTREDA